jgi:hypothetical protein
MPICPENKADKPWPLTSTFPGTIDDDEGDARVSNVDCSLRTYIFPSLGDELRGTQRTPTMAQGKPRLVIVGSVGIRIPSTLMAIDE